MKQKNIEDTVQNFVRNKHLHRVFYRPFLAYAFRLASTPRLQKYTESDLYNDLTWEYDALIDLGMPPGVFSRKLMSALGIRIIDDSTEA